VGAQGRLSNGTIYEREDDGTEEEANTRTPGNSDEGAKRWAGGRMGGELAGWPRESREKQQSRHGKMTMTADPNSGAQQGGSIRLRQVVVQAETTSRL
jgi:hypothetical protein